MLARQTRGQKPRLERQRPTRFQLAKDAWSLKIVNKDPASIVDKEWTFTNQAKAAENPKGDMNPEARATYSQAFQKALTSAGPALRADTQKRLQAAKDAGLL